MATPIKAWPFYKYIYILSIVFLFLMGEAQGAESQTMDGLNNRNRQTILTDIWAWLPEHDANSQMPNETEDQSNQEHNNTRDDARSDKEYDSLASDEDMVRCDTTKKKKRKQTQRSKIWEPKRLQEYEMENENQLSPDGYYIGDAGTTPNNTNTTMKIATTNINKNTWAKIDQEVADWFTANQIDALILSDSDISNEETKI